MSSIRAAQRITAIERHAHPEVLQLRNQLEKLPQAANHYDIAAIFDVLESWLDHAAETSPQACWTLEKLMEASKMHDEEMNLGGLPAQFQPG